MASEKLVTTAQMSSQAHPVLGNHDAFGLRPVDVPRARNGPITAGTSTLRTFIHARFYLTL